MIFHYSERSGQNLESGTEAESLEEYCLLAYSTWHVLNHLSFSITGYVPLGRTTYSWLDFPYHSTIKTIPSDMTTGLLDMDNCSFEFPSSHLTTGCVNLIIKTSHHGQHLRPITRISLWCNPDTWFLHQYIEKVPNGFLCFFYYKNFIKELSHWNIEFLGNCTFKFFISHIYVYVYK